MATKSKPDMDQKRALRGAARFYAVQALFQMEQSDRGVVQTLREFETHRIGAETDEETWVEADINHFRRLVETAVDRQAAIDQMTDRALVAKWPIDRIDPTLRALFRAAGAEMLGSQTPVRVVISEFVSLCGAFFPDSREQNFVNAVLDHMAHEARAEEF
jgi:transcription antitermination protein NusB